MNREKGSNLCQSLSEFYPRHNLWVCMALAACSGLLILALFQPILYTQQMFFWKQTYTIWMCILDLWKMGERLLAIVVFLFSMVFPFAKILALTCVWFVKLSQEQRIRFLRLLDMFGKWSMLDVFVVAILIVLIKVGSLARIEPRIGIHLFGAAIISSMLITAYIGRRVRTSTVK